MRYRSFLPVISGWLQRYSVEMPSENNLYEYALSSPLTLTDPLGLIANVPIGLRPMSFLTLPFRPGLPSLPVQQRRDQRSTPGFLSKPRRLDQDFYVCRRLVDVEGIARKCGCQHTDIYGSVSGELYQGWYGPIPPGKIPIPLQDPKWKCVLLSFSDTMILPYGNLWPRTFQWGTKAGQPCEGATGSDIVNCLQAKPKRIGDPGILENCQTDVQFAVQGCCLSGWVGVSALPAGGGSFGAW